MRGSALRIAIGIQRFVLCFVFPMLLGIFAYYGFSSTYSATLFDSSGFHAQYDYGIYRYRVLGKVLFLGIDHVLERYRHGQVPQLGTNFYLSYFLLNTTFVCLTAWALQATLDLPVFTKSEIEKKLWVMVVALLITVTQYVITPYDTLSYFFIVAAAYLMMRDSTPLSTLGLAAVMILGTLTRETPALIVALYAALWVMRHSVGFRPTIPVLATLFAVFLATYLGLRFALGWDSHAVDQGLTGHVPFKGIAGVLFLISGILLTMDLANRAKVKTALLFLAFSSPYLAVSLLTGMPFEVRLWVPIFLGLILIHAMRFDGEPSSTTTNG